MRNKFCLVAMVLLMPLGIGCSKRTVLNKAGTPEGEESTARNLKLELETSSQLDLTFNEQSTLRLRVMYADDGTPASDKPVAFAIQGSGGGASLAAATVLSGPDGRLNEKLTAGEDRTNFTVVATATNAVNSVTIQVTVDGTYKGALKVRFRYNDVVPLTGGVTAWVHRGSTACGTDGRVAPATPTLGQQHASAVTEILTFDNLDENQVFSVSVIGTVRTGGADREAAVGCIATPAIIGRGTVTVTVPLTLLSPLFEGKYDFGNQLHLNEMIPGTAGDVIYEVAAFLEDPAQMLTDLLVDNLASQIGNDPTGILAAGVHAMIDEAMSRYLPPQAGTAIQVSSDLLQLMTNLTVGGELEIIKWDGTRLDARWGWDKFLFRWRYDQTCDIADSCCGRSVFSGTEMGLRPIAGEFSATATRNRNVIDRISYDVEIPQHRLAVEYGNILLFVLHQFVLPQIAGANTINGTIENLIGCDNASDPNTCGCGRVGSYIDGLLGVPGLGNQVCEMALVGVTQVLEQRINELNFDGVDAAHFDAGLAAALEDADHDLEIDHWRGTLSGNLMVAQTPVDFTGTMMGDRQRLACGANSECETNQACVVYRDVLNDCAARLGCGMPRGTGLANTVCTSDAACQSGACMTNHQCFQACEASTDCPTRYTCGPNPATVTMTVSVDTTVIPAVTTTVATEALACHR